VTEIVGGDRKTVVEEIPVKCAGRAAGVEEIKATRNLPGQVVNSSTDGQWQQRATRRRSGDAWASRSITCNESARTRLTHVGHEVFGPRLEPATVSGASFESP